jgi:hypothetical protein
MDAQLVEWSALRHRLTENGFSVELIEGINAIADNGHSLPFPMEAIATPSSLVYHGGKIAISPTYNGEESEWHMFETLEAMGYDLNKNIYVIM